MDRYLFRGLRTDGEGWVYGHFINNPESNRTKMIYWKEENGLMWSYNATVIPETVGQWTGLTCKNRTVNVFEGDKFRYRLNRRYYESVIIFENGCFGFMENSYFIPLYQLADSQGDLDYFEVDFEVIGNIHEEN